jgi:hypothetical protein
LLYFSLHSQGPFSRVHFVFDYGENFSRDIFKGFGEAGRPASCRDFLRSGPGQKTVFKIIFFGSTGRLHRAKSYMMIGNKQPLFRNERAGSAQLNNSIEQTLFGRIINKRGIHPQPFLA